MAFGCSVAGPLVKSVSPMTRASRVVSTMTKLSDDTDRRLTASAGIRFARPGPRDVVALVGIDRAAAPMDEALFGEDPEDFLQVCRPNASPSVNGSSNAAHFT